MKFTVIGDIYMTVNEARRWRARIRATESARQGFPVSPRYTIMPEGVEMDLSTHDEYERELTRKYPICLAIRAYEVDRDTFETVISEFGMYAESTPTGGILGGDGGIGWTPAIAFNCEGDYDSFGQAYVTPWPETVRPITRPHSWERVAGAVFRTYEHGV